MNVTLTNDLPYSERRRLQARARRLQKRAETLAEKGRMEEAIACQTEVTDLRPNDSAAFFRLGLMYREARRTELALSALRRATDLRPDGRDSREALIATLLDNGRYREIVDESKQLVKIAPRSVFARDVLSLAYMQLGQPDKALRVVGELIWLDPINPDHYLKRAMLLQQQGNIKNAIGEYTRILEMADDESDIASVAVDALEVMDEHQLQQIMILAGEDRLFRWKALHHVQEAVQERGFYLTSEGLSRLRSMLQQPPPLCAGASAPGHIRLYN